MEAWCAEKCITIVSHPFLFVILFSNIHGTVYTCNICSKFFVSTTIGSASAIVPKQNDHVWSFWRFTVLQCSDSIRAKAWRDSDIWSAISCVQTWQCATLPGSDNRADICTEALNAGVMTRTGVSSGRPRQRRKTNVISINSWSVGFSWTVL